MKLIVNDAPVRFKDDFACLTDIAKVADRPTDDTIRAWLRNRKTLLYLEAWERVNNPKFKPDYLVGFRNFAEYEYNSVTVSKYIEMTKPIGLFSERGRYGGTYAHVEIAFEFATWLNPEFKVYFFKEWIDMKLQQSDQTVQFALHKAKNNLQEAADWIELVEQKKKKLPKQK